MIGDLVFGLGLVAIVEGLVLALAPSHLRAALEMIDRLEPESACACSGLRRWRSASALCG